MNYEIFEELVKAHLERRPFQVFTIELKTGQLCEIDAPNALAYKAGLASYLGPGRVLAWFDHDAVNQVYAATAEQIR